MPNKGSTYIMSEEQKENIRQSRLGYKPTPGTCRRISEALKGHSVSQRTRDNISRFYKEKRNNV